MFSRFGVRLQEEARRKEVKLIRPLISTNKLVPIFESKFANILQHSGSPSTVNKPRYRKKDCQRKFPTGPDIIRIDLHRTALTGIETERKEL